MTFFEKNGLSDNRRQNTRKTCSISLSYKTENRPYKEDSIINISSGGVFIKTDEDLAIGETITLKVKYLSVQEPFTVEGKVVSNKTDGVGVRFESLPSHLRDILNFMMW
jgi:Tfp pilus assembly protein PilZ